MRKPLFERHGKSFGSHCGAVHAGHSDADHQLAARRLFWEWRGPWGILAAELLNINTLRMANAEACGQLGGKNRGQLEEKNEENKNWYCLWSQVRTWFVENWQEYVPVDIGNGFVAGGDAEK